MTIGRGKHCHAQGIVSLSRLRTYIEPISELGKVVLELIRHLPFRIRHNRTHKRVIVVQEPVSLSCLSNTFTQLHKECLVLSPQPAKTARDGLIITSLTA